MTVEVPMPQLGEEATEADVLDWLAAEGDHVEAGEVLVELETDKSTVEYESPTTGVLREICVASGTQGVAVGTVLARIEPDEGERAAPEAPPARSAPEATEPSRTAGGGPSGPATDEPAPEAAGARGPVEVPMPLLGEEASEADVLEWLVAEGDTIRAGDVLVELETDKSTVEYESPVTGVLREIRVPAGTQGVAVGEVLAVIEPSEDAPPPRPLPAVEVEPRADTIRPPTGDATPAAPRPEPAAAGEGATTTPLARRLAEDAGIALRDVRGSGASGRVLKQDVEAAIRARDEGAPGEAAAEAPPAAARAEGPAKEPAKGPAAPEGAREVPLSRMRRTIARRLSESKQTVPHFYLRADCRLDRLLAVRRELNADDGVRISVNDFVVRAVALALLEVPAANVTWGEDVLVQYAGADVSVAVATDGGLVTPVVRDAHRKGLAAISAEVRDLATRAREGRLTPKEYQGGSVSVSNLGMYGIDSVYPIINPPQSAIFGIGQGVSRPVVHEGALVPATVMTCTLAGDHRAVDGAVGAELLAAFRRRIEEPLEMLI